MQRSHLTHHNPYLGITNYTSWLGVKAQGQWLAHPIDKELIKDCCGVVREDPKGHTLQVPDSEALMLGCVITAIRSLCRETKIAVVSTGEDCS